MASEVRCGYCGKMVKKVCSRCWRCEKCCDCKVKGKRFVSQHIGENA